MAREYSKRKRTVKPIFAKKRSVKQRVWDFMRRNRKFKLEDIVTILDLNINSVRVIIYALESAGMIRRDKKGKIKDATFTFLVKPEIVTSPIITPKEVYCTTTKRSYLIEAKGILKRVLKEKSQGQVAFDLNVDKTTVNLVLHNKYPNPEHIFKKIVKVYG